MNIPLWYTSLTKNLLSAVAGPGSQNQHNGGMEGKPRVVAPVAPLAQLDGITLLLITVELWPDSVTVRVAALPNERTARLDAEYRQTFEGCFSLARRRPHRR